MDFPLPDIDGPAAIAFSGGGDSTAMVHAFRDHPLINTVVIVDHRLRPESSAACKTAGAFAKNLGYKVISAVWNHDNPTTGIQVKARRARYNLMGAWCRRYRIDHLITAHTADDQAETLLMRLDRQTGWRGLAGMSARAYGPIWPELADMTLHRPWLDVSRTELRDYNRRHGLDFFDDPSNENRDFTRVRARQALAGDPDLRRDLLIEQRAARERVQAERAEHADWLARHAVISRHNFVTTDAVPPTELLLHILRAVSGTGGPIDRAKRAGLAQRMAQPDFKAATLAGAWVVKDGQTFVFTRDKVAVLGRYKVDELIQVAPRLSRVHIWDGRFIMQCKQRSTHISPCLGKSEFIRQSPESTAFFALPPSVRPTLPAFTHDSEVKGFGACDTDVGVSRATAARRLHDLYGPQIGEH